MKQIEVLLDIPDPGDGPVPITFGVPFPPGELRQTDRLRLLDGANELPIQTRKTAGWPDGTVRWVLADTLLPGPPAQSLKLSWENPTPRTEAAMSTELQEARFLADTGVARFDLPTRPGAELDAIEVAAPFPGRLAIQLRRPDQVRAPRLSAFEVEESGPVRTVVRIAGEFPGSRLRTTARFHFFAGTALLKLDLTIENPQRARHPRGVWDLGDSGSLHFNELSVSFRPENMAETIHYDEGARQPVNQCHQSLRIHQESSGGENWQSPNHRDARGRIPMRYRGYRIAADGRDSSGLRAQPIVGLATSSTGVAAYIEDFWQSFPSAFAADGKSLTAQLFPACPPAGEYELQGGEHKTHTIWFDFGTDWNRSCVPLGGFRAKPAARLPAEWYASAGVESMLGAPRVDPLLGDILREASCGPNSLAQRRETIDEYGWRNFGDVHADHEGQYYSGPAPVISHYNNQYDLLYGCLLQYLWGGDRAWYEIAAPLARHIVDIDLYDTTEDRPTYSGGLFWHTDHYLDAATATHRSYSKENRASPFASYGGGPSGEHNYATGLLLHHYLTGNPRSREAVLQLADWVIAMDDGTRNILGAIDPGPTGWATRTRETGYHGPGRGAANSVDTLLDAWLLQAEPRYLEKAEELIRRTVHPDEDIDRHQLTDIEARWSYIIFLRTLDRYRTLKQRHGQLDEAYEYARRSLAHYGRWMRDHETPYFDRRTELEYPTEAWPVLDIVKANVLRAAASCVPPDEARGMAEKADRLVARAKQDLAPLKTRASTRAISHLLREAMRDGSWRRAGVEPSAQPAEQQWIPPALPDPFVPQRQRIVRTLKHPSQWPRIVRHLLDPERWRAITLRRP